jgi:serine/threonine protein kinase/tetratricopeptide (TPR) repeat protein
MTSNDATLYAPDGRTAPELREAASVDPLQLERGTSIGRYVVVEKLGQGGMGVVYAAYDPQLDRKVAFKLLHSRKTPRGTAARQEKQDRLLREAQALARIAHANVIAVHDVGTFGEHIFVAMEYLEGEDLESWATEDRSWEEVLAAYIKAGRGLEAAHKAGLVHRDFKPENAFFCTDGRVKVLDFGLAHVSDPEALSTHDDHGAHMAESEAETLALAASGDTSLAGPRGVNDGSSSSLSIRMTKPGAILGTPAFMAPEQWEGAETDARSDQFSFCAALYEGVYGERPFAGASIPSIAFNIRRGEIREAPAGTKVPTWLRRVLLRGLSVKPDARWPTMGALLAELERDRAAPRRRLLAGAAVLGLLAGVWAYNAHQDEQRRAACRQGQSSLSEHWNPEKREQIRAAMHSTKLGYVGDTLGLVESRLGSYANDWEEQRLQACEATRLRGEQSEKVLDLRMACLERRRLEFATLVEVFVAADAKVVEKASAAVESLSPLEPCADVEALLSGIPAPTDEQVSREAEAIRQAISRSRTLRTAGRFKDADAPAREAVSRAEAVDYPPVLAEALLNRGKLHHDTGAYEKSQADLESALWTGTAHKHDQVVLRAANSLLSLVGFTLSKPEEAQVWARHAEAMLQRVGGNPTQEAELANGRGNLYLAQQRFEEAKAAYLEVLRIREAHGGTHLGSLAGTYGNLGTASIELGEQKVATEYFVEALELFKKAYGPKHPSTAKGYNNLGIALERAGDFTGAIEHQSKALEIKRELLGAKHPSVAGSLGNLANVRARMGDHQSASELYQEALEIFKAALGPDHPYVGRCHDGVGKAELELKHYDEALRQLERAAEIFAKSKNTERNLAATQFLLARALRGAGKEPARAEMLARESLGYLVKARAAGDESATEGDIDETIADVEAFLADKAPQPPAG